MRKREKTYLERSERPSRHNVEELVILLCVSVCVCVV